MESSYDLLAASRPTAVNLFWALERMRRRERPATPRPMAIFAEDLAANRAIGQHGATLDAARARAS